MFTWISIHREAAHRILGYRTKQVELVAILREMKESGLKVVGLEDVAPDGTKVPLSEIDPITFLASFNRNMTDNNRRENWAFLKTRWALISPVPEDFTGIPLFDNRSSRLFGYAKDREKDHIESLWEIAASAVDGQIETVNGEQFDRCLTLKCVGIGTLTIGLFWINPESFLPADNKTRAYGVAKGIAIEPTDYKSYSQWLKEFSERVSNNFPQASHDAHLFAIKKAVAVEPGPEPIDGRQYWWLNANPKMWNFVDTPVGARQTYTSRNEAGNKRQKYKYFQEAKPGDLIVGYVTSPQKEVVALCEVTQGLHQTEDGEKIEFEKTEQLENPLPYETLLANPELAQCEPLISNQGSLFKLREEEFEIIRSLIDEANEKIAPIKVEPFDKKKALGGYLSPKFNSTKCWLR